MAVSFQTDAEPIPGYRLLDRLGSGGFGEVWRCVAPGGIFKAVKVIHGDLRQTDDDAHRFAEQELKALKRVKTVRHPYLLALDRFDIVEGRLVIVMELADRNLWDRFRECRGQGLPGIPRDELLGYMAECAEVLDLMNGQHSLQHLDIKPQNLFLLYNHVKVADFGQVKDLERHVAQVTGGITPVYAAPETFDGFVSRYCDQYSLAIVYQELLTGIRPFDGTSMQQLLMQHLQAPPNLQPSPPSDRPALARALAKVPDERFPTIAAMVAGLRSGTAGRVVTESAVAVGAGGGRSFAPIDDDPGGWREKQDSGLGPHSELFQSAGLDSSVDDLPHVLAGPEQTYFPRQPPEATAVPVERAAPPELRGDGPIRPALILGVGYTGLRVVRRFRRRLEEVYGSADRLPAVRALYLDTDPDALDAVITGPPTNRLPADIVVPLRLNRSGYYLKPRNNGRMLIEGWFDPDVLYKLSRVPVTMGLRSLGRLAFCDHYRAVMQKVSAELDACLAPEALLTTCRLTDQPLGTNRPRVYVVAGLGGGTGGGLSLDLAYAVRAKLKRLGYDDPDVVAVFLTPADPAGNPPTELARANTYATLTELHHYTHPDTSYVAMFEDRYGNIVDNAPPFSRVYMMPGLSYPAAEAGSGTDSLPPGVRGSGTFTAADRRSGVVAQRSGVFRRPNQGSAGPAAAPDAEAAERIDAAAEFLRLTLLTRVGPSAEAAARPAAEPTNVHALGLQRLGWPRAAVVNRVARLVAPVLLGHWVVPEPTQLAARVSQWVTDLWQRLALNPDKLTEHLRTAADATIRSTTGAPLNQWLSGLFEPFAPKGWLSRGPEAARVGEVTDLLSATFGPPRDHAARNSAPLAEALDAATGILTNEVTAELSQLIPQLHDSQEFRVAGATDAVRQLLIAVDSSRAHVEPKLAKLEASAAAAYDRLKMSAFPQKGVKKATAAEIAQAFRDYTTDWLEAMAGRRAVTIYSHLHEMLLARLAELTACRQRLEELHTQLVTEADAPTTHTSADGLLPAGCSSTEEAARKFVEVLNDDDLAELERRFQSTLEASYGGVFEICLNTAEGPEAIRRLLRETACDYLDGRLGEVDLAGMVRQKYGSPAAIRDRLYRLWDQAQPKWVGGGPWARAEVTVFAAPDGDGGAPLTRLAATLLPPDAVVTTTPDEVTVIREYPNVPLAALPQLGPAWSSAYQAFRGTLDTNPHTRHDITEWRGVDE